MKRWKVFMLSTVLITVLLGMVACGGNTNPNTTEAPYEDETDKNVNDTGINGNTDTNGTQNRTQTPVDPTRNTVPDDMRDSGGNLKKAGENLMDSVKDAGDAIRDGVDDVTEPNQNRTNTNNNTTNNNTTNNNRTVNP